MDLNLVRLFVDAADQRNMAAAARKNGISPSTATRRIAELEREFGSRLFLRSTRLIELTEAGIVLRDWARVTLGSFEQTKDVIGALQGQPEGLVRVGCPQFLASQYLAPMLGDFIERHPGITLSLIVTDRTIDLSAGNVDIAIHAGDKPDGFLIGRKLWNIDIVLCATPKYLARFGTPEHPSDLDGHRCITHSIYNPRDWLFEVDGRIVTQPIRSALQSSNTMLLRELALADIGIIRTTRRMVVRELEEGRLVELLTRYNPTNSGAEGLETWIIYPDRQMLRRTRVVIDELTNFLLSDSGKSFV
jgi:DNA-binding transcriptional LysR family regulator